MRGLFMAADAPLESSQARLTGNELRRGRWDVNATERQVAAIVGTTQGNVRQLEARADRSVPLRWEEPLRAALRQLADVPGQDDQARHDILEAVDKEAGISRFRLGAMGRTQVGSRALKALVEDGELVERSIR